MRVLINPAIFHGYAYLRSDFHNNNNTASFGFLGAYAVANFDLNN
jgi:hypothetical protein